MALNTQNLKPCRTKEEARRRGKNGGIASGKARKERKTLREELLLLLQSGNVQESIVLAMIEKAKNGDTKAFEVIRDTIGEKPVDKVEVTTIDPAIVNEVERMVNDDS